MRAASAKLERLVEMLDALVAEGRRATSPVGKQRGAPVPNPTSPVSS